ncbi:MAG: DNA recombination protein RmuC [Acidobacteriaceae bacterium]|nr:DNA recombination protein RmuC [Acidobacteriaceae bacterium]
MSAFTAALLLCLLGMVGFAAYQLSEARRWRHAAAEERSQAETHRADLERTRRELDDARRDVVLQQSENTKSRELAEVQLKLLTQTQQQLEEKFRALAAEALQNNSQMMLDRSRDHLQQLVEPVNQSLRKFEEQVQAIEKSRAGAYESITAQVQALTQLQERVRHSTDQLKTALRSPIQRGRWGEMQLRRVVELAGMLDYCDFSEQETLFGETTQRPDLIVHLPNHCRVVVDAKVSLDAYLRSIEAQDEAERQRFLVEHARQVKAHVRILSEKAYWQRVNSPEFVVAFLPLESLFSAALEHDPELLAYAATNRVVIASPITLITLLLTVAYGWRQQAVVENLDKIRDTGTELYKRLLTMGQHFSKLGDAIEKTVGAYNDTIGSLERNVLTSARKFRDLRPATADEIEVRAEIDASPRNLDPGKWQALEAAGKRG